MVSSNVPDKFMHQLVLDSFKIIMDLLCGRIDIRKTVQNIEKADSCIKCIARCRYYTSMKSMLSKLFTAMRQSSTRKFHPEMVHNHFESQKCGGLRKWTGRILQKKLQKKIAHVEVVWSSCNDIVATILDNGGIITAV